MSKIDNRPEVSLRQVSMIASLDANVLLLARELSRLPADRLKAVRRIAAKLEAGCLRADDLNAVVERIRAGTVTFDEGVALLATTH